jgi:hypothetical protein
VSDNPSVRGANVRVGAGAGEISHDRESRLNPGESLLLNLGNLGTFLACDAVRIGASHGKKDPLVLEPSQIIGPARSRPGIEDLRGHPIMEQRRGAARPPFSGINLTYDEAELTLPARMIQSGLTAPIQ